MKDVAVSIVMPLYNTERYLEESLESVLKQTFTNYELICVNDGSTDKTPNILEKFCNKDNRIWVVTNSERLGAACSRNKGMGMAKGKYLVFLDGDDIFDETMLERAYDAIEKNTADIVMFDYQHVPTERIHNKLHIDHGQKYRDKYCEHTFTVYDCEPYELINWPLGPCNKLYRRMFIQDNCLEFQNISCANDVFFVYMALLLSSRTIVLDSDRVMLYARDHFEASRISCNRDSRCSYDALMKIGEELVQRGKFGQLYEYFYFRVFFSLKDSLIADKNEERAKDFYAFLQRNGIAKLCSLGDGYYARVDEYLQKEMKQFLEKSFESGWYKEENALKFALYKKSKEVIDLYNMYRATGAKIVIWGAGVHGKTLLSFCIQHNLEIAAVIDKSEEKQGSLWQGYKITSPDKVLDQIQVILISARFIYDEVVKEVNGREIEVIDMNQFLYIS